MEEKWVGIKGFEGKYQISNLGNVKSLDYTNIDKRGFAFTKKGKQLKTNINMHGYRTIGFHFNYKNCLKFIHRLIAEAFIPNPENKPCVHHIDHNKLNNSIDNLMWVSYSENIAYNYSTGGQIGKTNMKGKFGVDNPNSKKVKQLTIDGILIKIHDGISEAAREVSGQATHIVKVCRGLLNKHKGFKWSYV